MSLRKTKTWYSDIAEGVYANLKKKDDSFTTCSTHSSTQSSPKVSRSTYFMYSSVYTTFEIIVNFKFKTKLNKSHLKNKHSLHMETLYNSSS